MVVMAIEVPHETIREMILSFNSRLLVKLCYKPGQVWCLVWCGKDRGVLIVSILVVIDRLL